jgi:MOSC domain-containing protein YiiM
MGKIISVNISEKKGTVKKPVSKIELVEDHGVKDDAHAAPGDRQISLLMQESLKEMALNMKDKPGCEKVDKGVEIGPGIFAENITTEGIDLVSMTPGMELAAGDGVILEITKIGKDCHRKCAIYYKVGDCIMPKKGVFAKVIKGGSLKAGDPIGEE